MGLISKKRLLLTAGGVTTVAAAATLVAGTTFGLFSVSVDSAPSSFSAGTVDFGSGGTTTCTITHMVPGDSSTGYSKTITGQTNAKTDPCTFVATYIGSAPGYLAVDVAVGGTGLYDGTSKGLQLEISDGTTSYTTSGVLNSTTGGGNATDLLVSTTPDAGSSNTVHTFTINYALPLSSDDTYQGLDATVTLTVHAVQSGNNNFVGSCTAGSACGTASDWS